MTGRNVEDVVWTKVERGSILELDPHPTDRAARIMALAHPGEICVSETTRVLAAGSVITFEVRGDHELKGIEGSRRLFALSAGGDPSSGVSDVPRCAGSQGMSIPSTSRAHVTSPSLD
jgi:class 3 adenylate cyclase